MSLASSPSQGGGRLTPLSLSNRPGLRALAYRIGTYASFFETMRQRLSAADFALESGAQPLARLTTRNASDPSIALLDAWAIVADVLTFYQERIANEGYLGTAVERQSMVNLAAAVGYALRPGISATVSLAYTLEQSAQVTIPPGSRVQNMPASGDLPQSFETSDALEAQGAWNNLAPRLSRPQIIDSAGDHIYLAGIHANLKANDPVLILAEQKQPRRVASLTIDYTQKRTEVALQPLKAKAATSPDALATQSETTFQPTGSEAFSSSLSLVAALSKPPADTPRSALQLQRNVAQTFQPEMDTTSALLQTLHPTVGKQLYDGLRNATVTQAPAGEFHALRVQAPPFGHNAPLRPVTNASGAVVGSEDWPLGASSFIGIALSGRSEAETQAGALSFERALAMITTYTSTAQVRIVTAAGTSTGAVPVKTGKYPVGKWAVEVTVDAQAHVLSFTLPGLGHTYQIEFDRAANVMIVTVDKTGSPIRVLHGESASTEDAGRRTLVSLVDGILIEDQVAIALDENAAKVVSLDMVYDQIIPGSWVVIERADGAKAIVTQVVSAQKVSLKKYGMAARVTQLTLADAWLQPKTDLMLDVARNTTISAQSERLDVADEPFLDLIQGDRIELENLYGGLQSGRWLVVQGERADGGLPAGVMGAELVMLANLQQGVQTVTMPPKVDGGVAAAAQTVALPGDRLHSFLQLANPLSYKYKRDTATIYGNVVLATHGESRKEILGGGDGAEELQQFDLHQGPLSYVATANADGAQSTLAVAVNGLTWQEVPTLASAGPNDRVYTTQVDASGKRTLTFGNGKHGMRLPSGMANVIATYRSGIGEGGNADSGKVTLLATRPLGVKTVVNPIPASGGSNGDTTEQVRQNAPVAVAALDRLVSVSDYGAFARTFAGIGKASAQSLSDGHRRLVFVTIAGTEGPTLDTNSAVYSSLVQAFQQLGDPQLPVQIAVCERLLLVVSARVKIYAGYDFNQVEPQIRATLLHAFSFENQQLAQSIELSAVTSLVQSVAGVQYVRMDVLDSISERETRNPAVFKARLKEIASATAPHTTVFVADAVPGSAAGTIQPAGLAYLSPALPDTLALTEITS